MGWDRGIRGGRKKGVETYSDSWIGFFYPEDVFVIFIIVIFVIRHGCRCEKVLNVVRVVKM